MNRTALVIAGMLLATAVAGAQISLSISPNTATAGLGYAGTVSASGGTAPYSFGPTSCAQGLSMDASGSVTGTPTAGTCTLSVSVTDSTTPTPNTASQDVSVTVYPPVTVSGTFPSGVAGVAYSATPFTATGGSGSYTWSASGLPANLTMNSAGAISGTPAAAGSPSVTVTATDTGGNGASGSITATLVIAPPAVPLSVTTASLPNWTMNVGYTSYLSATGGTGTGYTWSVTLGSLPAGLTLNSDGSITGIPTAAGNSNFTVQVKDSAGATATSSETITINPPLSITGTLPSGTLNTAYTGNLTVSGGTGTDTWSITSGSLPAGLTLSSGAITGTPTASGTSIFTVQVKDSVSAVATSPESITINLALSISGTLPSGTVGTAYTGTLTAAGGTGTGYSWSITSGSLPAGLTLNAGSITGGPTASGTSNFTVQVKDSANTVATSSESITINPAVTISGSLPHGTVGTAYSANLTAGGGTGTGYVWSITSGSLPAGLTMSSGAITGSPTASGTSNFTVQVKDSANAVATSSESITINPAVSITSGSLSGGTVNVAYSATLTATGGTGTGYTWSITSGALPGGLNLNSATGAIGGTPSAAGTFGFTVRVTDSGSSPASASESIIIAPALAITTTALPSGALNSAYTATLAATGGTPPYTWSVTGLPAGITPNSSTGVISGIPTAAGTSTVNIQVKDAQNVTASASLGIVIASALAVATASLPNGSVGAVYSATLTQAGGNAPYTWSASGLPGGIGLNAQTGVLSGTPTAAGTYQVNTQVVDTNSITATKSLTLTITTGLAVTIAPLATGYVAAPYSASLAATGGSPPYTWSLAGGALPPGLTLASAGSIAGTPTQSGTFNFVVKVTDSVGTTQTQALSMTVGAALTIATASLPTGAIGTSYSQTLSATGGLQPYTWSLLAGALPVGLNLGAGGIISGIPSSAGTFAFTVQVQDGIGTSVVKALSLTIASSLTITSTSPLPVAALGSTYSQALAAISGAPPYTWAVSSGSLPPGITLDPATGVLGGKPTRGGTFSFTVTVKDAVSASVSKQFSLTVVGALTVTTTSFPGGTISSPYAQILGAVAGTSPYTWSLSTGSLPPGLALNSATGAITGTPITQGTYNFTVKVTDAVGATATQALSIVIGAAPMISSGPALANGTLGTAYSTTLAAAGGTPPYTWSISAGALPGGLTLDPSSGAITGTPQAAGSFSFTVQVSDAAHATATAALSLNIGVQGLPTVTITGLSDTATSLEQPTVSLALSGPAPTALTGQLVLTFESDAVVQGDDPSIQFSTGGRTADFTVAANATSATFPASPLLLQTGSVAGTITLTVKLQAGGADVTPTPAPSQTVKIGRTAPVIRALKLVTTASGFEVWITGYSPSRELTQAVVEFTPAAGSNLQTTSLTVPLSAPAGQWYQDASSAQYGSQFTIVQPFTVTGAANAVSSVSVTLSNALGTSAAVSASF